MTEMPINQAIQRASELHAAGKPAEAEALCRQVLARQPANVETLQLLGLALAAQSRMNDAVDVLGRAASLRPDDPTLLSNLGNALMIVGQLPQAIVLFRKAVTIDGKNVIAVYNLGRALCTARQWPEAVNVCSAAVAMLSGSADARVNLAVALRETGRIEESLAVCREALAIDPNHTAALSSLGSALAEKGLLDEAIASWRRALEIDPNSALALSNIGSAQLTLGRAADAVQEFRSALAVNPEFAPGHWNLSLALLLQGDYAEGFAEYEWRFRVPSAHEGLRKFDRPRWDGSPLNGRRILLSREQGLGDAIHFIRFVPMVARLGGKVILECDRTLKRLFATVTGVDRIIEAGLTPDGFDVYSPLLSLPNVLGVRLENIPANVPYLAADPAAIERWRARLTSLGNGPKVGITWAGSSGHRRDRRRSITLETLAPFAGAGNARFVSLQKDRGSFASSPLNAVDWTAELCDFADTAALIAGLDLVISVDTAVAHVAGAMAKPVWLLLPFAPDWRWMAGREDSPWYPTMRLFRQQKPDDWSDPIARMAALLCEM